LIGASPFFVIATSLYIFFCSLRRSVMPTARQNSGNRYRSPLTNKG
jgi:hypothetical protein